MAYSKNVGIVWSKTPEAALYELTSAYGDLIKLRMRETLRSWAKNVRQYMQANAPWQDRSSDARAGLNVAVGGNQFGTWLTLSHTVPYGTFLEGVNPESRAPMANAGKWSIIEPTVDVMSQKIWTDILGQFRR